MANCCAPCEETVKHMSLEDWRQQMCIAPWYFWQWEGENCRNCGSCKRAITEFLWQDPSDMARDDIAASIREAEEMIRDYVGYPVVPTWVSEEVEINRWCEWSPLRLKYTHVQAVGEPVETLLGTADVTVTVPPNDACPDTFEVIYTLTPQQVTDNPDLAADEICIRVPDEYAPLPHQAPHWDNEIRPVHVSIAGDTITVQGSAWLAGRPIPRFSPSRPMPPNSLFTNSNTFDPLWFGGEWPNPGDPFFESNYLPELDIYRKTIDPCGGGKMRYDSHVCACGNRECGADENTSDDDHCGCCVDMVYCLTNGRTGIVKPMPQDCCNLGCNCRCSTPTHHCIRYLAYDCSRDWRPVIAKLSASLLCDRCNCANQIVSDLQVDLAREDVRENGRRISFSEQDAPWGTRAGAVQAWKFAKRNKRLKAVRM